MGEDEDIVFYGNVMMNEDTMHEYDKIRAHMIRAPRGQKYLARFEDPESAPATFIAVNTAPSCMRGYPSYIHNPVDSWRSAAVQVQVQLRKAVLNISGGCISPATIAAHEIAHAVRFQQSACDRQIHQKMEPYFRNAEEHHIISKLEQEVARANQEDPSDTHTSAGTFTVGHVRSTEPINPSTKGIVDLYSTQLQAITKTIDDHHLDTKYPYSNGQLHRYFARRDEIANEARAAIERSERL